MSIQPGDRKRIGAECFWKGHLCTVTGGPDELGYYTVTVDEDPNKKELHFSRASLREESEDIVKFNINLKSGNFTGK